MAFLIGAAIVMTLTIIFAQFNQLEVPLAVPYTDIKFKTTFFMISMVIFVLGFVTGLLIMLDAYFKTFVSGGKLKRQLEKTMVGADDSDLRVKTLENKVQTLEAALKKAMENN
jgi:uncharacterized membrane protein YciS (DUF1049 family)